MIAESFERIHRSNLIGMGVLPLQYKDGQSTQSLGLTGRESFEIAGLNRGAAEIRQGHCESDDGKVTEFEARLRIDTPKELDYYQHGGILQYVLRSSPRQARRLDSRRFPLMRPRPALPAVSADGTPGAPIGRRFEGIAAAESLVSRPLSRTSRIRGFGEAK